MKWKGAKTSGDVFLSMFVCYWSSTPASQEKEQYYLKIILSSAPFQYSDYLQIISYPDNPSLIFYLFVLQGFIYPTTKTTNILYYFLMHNFQFDAKSKWINGIEFKQLPSIHLNLWSQSCLFANDHKYKLANIHKSLTKMGD